MTAKKLDNTLLGTGLGPNPSVFVSSCPVCGQGIPLEMGARTWHHIECPDCHELLVLVLPHSPVLELAAAYHP